MMTLCALVYAFFTFCGWDGLGDMAKRPLIIPVFLPYLGCRERCLFCNQKVVAQQIPSPSAVRKLIESSLIGLPPNKNNRERQVAFYGGSFTAIHRDDQIRYLKEVRSFLLSGMIDSLRISTRPDALDGDTLSLLKKHGVKTVEIGAQSMIDEVLLLSQRGHRAEDSLAAVRRLKLWGFEVGLHLMVGLPGDTFDRFLQTVNRVIDLKPDFVRIHPTLVLKGAPLEVLWRAGRYSTLSLEEVIEWLKKGVLKLEGASIPVARMGLQPTKDLEEHLIAGPYHPALHQLVDSSIFFDMAAYLLRHYPNGSQAIFLCHPKEVSNLRGQRNQNILKLKEEFGFREIFIQSMEEVQRGWLILRSASSEVSMHRKPCVF
jgi:histone acetyltransferase (RNA polymerase elongator complex component)